MANKRELNLKPSFTHELHGFPSAQLGPLWEKIVLLQTDPLPDGKLKKKLVNKQDIYRLRVGDHRVFYTFSETWIRLLALRRRDDHTYGADSASVKADAPETLAVTDDDAAIEAAIEGDDARTSFVFDHAKTPSSKPLSREITSAWLSSLGIAAEHHTELLACKDEDAFLAVSAPTSVLERVMDNLFPKSIGEVLAQPDLLVTDARDLVRFKEGELIAFLLKLDAEQEKLTRWALKGPTLVKGGAGTGKSTVALYRVKALLERKGASGEESLLFTTYTRALERATGQLLDQLLTPLQRTRVRVATCDAIAREIVAASRKVGDLDDKKLRAAFREVRQAFVPEAPSGFEQKARARALAQIPDEYLLDEIEWVIDGRDLATLEDYLQAPRPGRGIAFGDKVRSSIWQLAGAYKQRLSTQSLETFADLRREALVRVRAGQYTTRWDHVLVDEAQDLSPASLALLAELARTAEGVFFAADSKQSLYSRNYTFASVHPRLDFKGRTALLSRNYRSTAEIDRAAFALLAQDDSALEPSESPQTGPLPVLARGFAPVEESRWIARFMRQMASFLHLQVHTGAVLVPDSEAGTALAQGLCQEGIAAKYFSGKELDLKAPVVKVLTLHSAKGLEFPTVVIAGLRPGTYPIESTFASSEEYSEAIRQHRRLLYVGMTRAMRGLLVLQPKGSQDPCLQGLSPDRWMIQEAP